MNQYDTAVLDCFLLNQRQLFPKDVAKDQKQAQAFLAGCMAVVVDSVEEVWEYFEEAGVDMDGADEEEIIKAQEVFIVGDGRYLIVEG